MFEVSWGELIVVTGLGFALIGKKDLPRAAGMVGNRLGRIVGLLQGARARADTFAQQTELRQLHNELKSGLRELDAVKSEMAVAMSSRGMQGIGSGGSIQRTVLSSSQPQQQFSAPVTPPLAQPTTTSAAASTTTTIPGLTSSSAATNMPAAQQAQSTSTRELPPESQTIAAVAEDEWVKQGIGFRSRAERGVGLGYSDQEANNPLNSGSSILSNIYQQNLIFDQYDRVVQGQEAALKSKIDDVKAKRDQQKDSTKKE